MLDGDLTLREMRTVAIVQDHAVRDVAARFGVSRHAIYMRMTRARRKRPDLCPPRVEARGRHVAASQLGSIHDPLNLDSIY